MRINFKNVVVLVVGVMMISVLSGCTNWHTKYDDLNVEYQNLEGRFDNCIGSLEASASQQQQLGSELAKRQQMIDELQRQIDEQNVTPGDATGFGDNMDVSVDAAAGTITVTLPNTLLFTSGKAELKTSTIQELDHIRSVLRERYNNMPIDVVGHTDSDPIKKSKWADNWQLSSERALAVLRYLNKQGVRDDQIRAVAAGSSLPVASNATTSGKAKNRRVEIVVHTR